MNARCGLEDCDCGHTIERLEARLDCGKDTDCADEVETQEQCLKHYVLYAERSIAEGLTGKEGYAGALDRLQQRFNEVWVQHQRLVALAKRFATSLHYKDVHELNFKDCPYIICQEARDAIQEAKS